MPGGTGQPKATHFSLVLLAFLVALACTSCHPSSFLILESGLGQIGQHGVRLLGFAIGDMDWLPAPNVA